VSAHHNEIASERIDQAKDLLRRVSFGYAMFDAKWRA
jgi:hypothetical protein